MLNVRSAALAALVLAACGGPNRAAVGNAGGATLADAVRAEIGVDGPVAIVPSPDGLLAISADGVRNRTLVPGAVPWALVDHDLGVVWFGSPDRTEIRMLDLRAAPGAPRVDVIATGLPAAVDPGGPVFGVSHASPGDEPAMRGFADLEYSTSILPAVVLVVGPEPQLTTAGGILEIWGSTEDFDAAVASAKLPGLARLKEVAMRATSAQPDPELKSAGTVADVDPDACENGECGQAQEVPGTGLWRVVVSFACGDGCYTGWRLYDPAKRTFLEGQWANWAQRVEVAADGSAFVSEGRVIRFDRGVVAGPAEDDEPVAEGGGWLDRGTWLPL